MMSLSKIESKERNAGEIKILSRIYDMVHLRASETRSEITRK